MLTITYGGGEVKRPPVIRAECDTVDKIMPLCDGRTSKVMHSSIETTLQTYVHDTKAMTAQSVDILEKAVSAQN